MTKMNFNRAPQTRLEKKRESLPFDLKKHKEILLKCIKIAQEKKLKSDLAELLHIHYELFSSRKLRPFQSKKLWNFHFKHIQTKEIICKPA